MRKAIKRFDIEEGYTRRGNYRIRVKFNNKVVAVFSKKTETQAKKAFHKAGYELMAWAEGSRIIVSEEEKIQVPNWDGPPGLDPDDKRQYVIR